MLLIFYFKNGFHSQIFFVGVITMKVLQKLNWVYITTTVCKILRNKIILMDIMDLKQAMQIKIKETRYK